MQRCKNIALTNIIVTIQWNSYLFIIPNFNNQIIVAVINDYLNCSFFKQFLCNIHWKKKFVRQCFSFV